MPTLSLLSQITPPSLHPLFTVTWLHLMMRLTPAYRIKLISTKQGSLDIDGGEKCGVVAMGRGKTTTMGQKKSTAERSHNEKRAGRWLVLGLMSCWMLGLVVGVEGGDYLFSVEELGLISLLLVRMVSRTMFGCAG